MGKVCVISFTSLIAHACMRIMQQDIGAVSRFIMLCFQIWAFKVSVIDLLQAVRCDGSLRHTLQYLIYAGIEVSGHEMNGISLQPNN